MAEEMEDQTVRQEDTEPSSEGETTEESAKEQDTKPSGGSAFEGIYERLPDISVRSVDRFILLCVIALIAVILIGILKANHVF